MDFQLAAPCNRITLSSYRRKLYGINSKKKEPKGQHFFEFQLAGPCNRITLSSYRSRLYESLLFSWGEISCPSGYYFSLGENLLPFELLLFSWGKSSALRAMCPPLFFLAHLARMVRRPGYSSPRKNNSQILFAGNARRAYS